MGAAASGCRGRWIPTAWGARQGEQPIEGPRHRKPGRPPAGGVAGGGGRGQILRPAAVALRHIRLLGSASGNLKSADWAGAVKLQPWQNAGAVETVLAGHLPRFSSALEVLQADGAAQILLLHRHRRQRLYRLPLRRRRAVLVGVVLRQVLQQLVQARPDEVVPKNRTHRGILIGAPPAVPVERRREEDVMIEWVDQRRTVPFYVEVDAAAQGLEELEERRAPPPPPEDGFKVAVPLLVQVLVAVVQPVPAAAGISHHSQQERTPQRESSTRTKVAGFDGSAVAGHLLHEAAVADWALELRRTHDGAHRPRAHVAPIPPLHLIVRSSSELLLSLWPESTQPTGESVSSDKGNLSICGQPGIEMLIQPR